MNGQKISKIKQLQALLRHGGIITQNCLNKHNIYRQLTNQYLKSGWLTKIGTSAYKRPGDTIYLESGLNTLEQQLSIPVHIAAKSALEIKGGLHYLKLGANDNKVLFSLADTRDLPRWFNEYQWKQNFIFIKTNLFPSDLKSGLTKEIVNQFEVTVSSKERAIFELLYLIPKHQTWDEASLIFENLVALRPDLLQELLENCSSIKVKRLFLFFAEKHKHQWFDELNLNKVNLGKGDRHLYKNGTLDKTYRITVPTHLHKKGK